ncbi:F-box protein GID2 [Marchantia polymorpha subsp. ruderalis]
MVSIFECQLVDGHHHQETRWIAREGAKRQKVVTTLQMDSNDDIIYEVMKHLDAKSLATATCVSKQWRKVAEDESLWENVCIQHWPSPVARQKQLRSVVLALGGFRRLYVLCLRPLLARGRPQPQALPSSLKGAEESGEREWSKDEVHLSLSLFSIDCYERLGRRHMTPSSMKFLCKPSANLSIGAHRMLGLGQQQQPASNVR